MHVGKDGMYRLTPAETTRLEAMVHVLVLELDDQWGSLMTVACDTPGMVDGRDAGFDDDGIISVHCGNGVTVHYSQSDLEEAVLFTPGMVKRPDRFANPRPDPWVKELITPIRTLEGMPGTTGEEIDFHGVVTGAQDRWLPAARVDGLSPGVRGASRGTD